MILTFFNKSGFDVEKTVPGINLSFIRWTQRQLVERVSGDRTVTLFVTGPTASSTGDQNLHSILDPNPDPES